jgi:hypothetical protein
MHRCRIQAALGLAVATLLGGAFVHPAAAQQPVRDLRLVDASGAPLPQEDAGPGEKRYHLENGGDKLYMAFDCTGETSAPVQLRLLLPLGAPIVMEDRECLAAGTQVVEYDPADNPLADNEYVVNLYVGAELYVADSLQFTVGAARIPGSVLNSTPIAPADATVVAQAPVDSAVQGGVSPAADTSVPGSPSRWMLVVAVAAIIGLMGLVLWAGRSAMRA